MTKIYTGYSSIRLERRQAYLPVYHKSFVYKQSNTTRPSSAITMNANMW